MASSKQKRHLEGGEPQPVDECQHRKPSVEDLPSIVSTCSPRTRRRAQNLIPKIDQQQFHRIGRQGSR